MSTQPEDDPLEPLLRRGQTSDWDVDRLWGRVRADTIESSASSSRPRRARPVVPLHRTNRTPFIAAGVLVAAGLAGLFVVTRDRSASPPSAESPAREYSTGIGERAAITLADGSAVTLAPASRLTIPASFGVTRREVALRGQASFQVQHDAAAPFRVRAGAGTIEDIGTTFDVRAYDSTHVVVIVSEGEVALRAGTDSTRAAVHLVAGESGSIGLADAMRERRPASEAAWTGGRLVFTGRPLAEVLESLARWYDLDIRVADTLRERRVTAEFAADRPQEMIESLAAAVGATASQSGRVVTLTPRSR